MVGVTLRMPLAAIEHFLPMDKKQITAQFMPITLSVSQT